MRLQLDELEALVRKRICAACELRADERACSHRTPGRCALFELFPLVAQAIAATESGPLENYLKAIRENVCAVCVDQALDGNCRRRQEAACALDAYLVEIVEVIEEATGRSFDRQRLLGPKGSRIMPLAAEP